MNEQGLEVDWKALVVGSIVTFLSVISLFWISGKLGYLPTPERPVRNLSALFTNPTILFVAISSLPGTIAAGYIHSSNPLSGAIYGIAAIIIGWVLPTISIVILFFGLIGLLGRAPDTFLLAIPILALSVPLFAIVVIVGGITGGVIGSLLRGWRFL